MRARDFRHRDEPAIGPDPISPRRDRTIFSPAQMRLVDDLVHHARLSGFLSLELNGGFRDIGGAHALDNAAPVFFNGSF